MKDYLVNLNVTYLVEASSRESAENKARKLLAKNIADGIDGIFEANVAEKT